MKKILYLFFFLQISCLISCNSLFYYPSHETFVRPEKFNIKYKDYFFSTKSDVKLNGRVFYHNSANPYKGLFVLFHGNAQNLSSHWLEFGWVLNRGFDLFVFDYPGYGKSQGVATRRSTIEGGNAALKLVSDSMVDKKFSLVLVGASLGGAILLQCFPDWQERKTADLIVAESTFPSYREAARGTLSKNWITWGLQPLSYFLITENGSPKKRIRNISPTPLLVTTCEEDQVVNPKFGNEIYELALNPKWIWKNEKCGHIQSFRTMISQEKLINLIDSLKVKHEN